MGLQLKDNAVTSINMEILTIEVRCVVLVAFKDAMHHFTDQHCTFSVFVCTVIPRLSAVLGRTDFGA